MRKIRKKNKKNGSRKISDKVVENRWNQVSAELMWIPAWWCLTCFPVKSQQHRQALTEITKVKWCDMHLPRSSRPFLQSCFAFRPAYHWIYFISSSFDNFLKNLFLEFPYSQIAISRKHHGERGESAERPAHEGCENRRGADRYWNEQVGKTILVNFWADWIICICWVYLHTLNAQTHEY